MKKILVALAIFLAACNAQATFTLTLTQNGADVLMDGSGSLDLTGASVTALQTFCSPAGVFSPTVLCTGAGQSAFRVDNAFATAYSAPGAISRATTITSGGAFFLTGQNVFLPVASGVSFTNQSRFTSTTLAAMGIPAGTVLTYNLVSGDTIVIRAVAAPAPAAVTSIPTLSEYGIMALASLMAMVGFAYMRRTQRRD